MKIEYLGNKYVYKKVLHKINRDYNKYLKTYRYIHLKKRSTKKILNIQYNINELIYLYHNLIKNLKNDENILITYKEFKIDSHYIIDIYNKLIDLYKLLIDDLIIKYCCSNDCMIFNQLIDNYQENSNYNYENIVYYLDIAKRDYLNRHTYCLICDMSKFNLKCGDVVMFSLKDGFNYKEIKSGEHSKMVVDHVLNNQIKKLNDKDYKEALRIKKQFDKHNNLDSIAGLPIIEDGFRFSEKLKKEETFERMIKKDLKRLKNKSYIEKQVDSCISYLIVNNSLINEKSLNKIDEYKCNGVDRLTYNEFIWDSSIHRPYFIKWRKKDYINLIMDYIIIYIKIDSIKFLKLLNNETDILKLEKALPEDYRNKTALIINGKKIVIVKEDDYELVLGNMIFYRIASLFYTTTTSINKFISDINSINFKKIK